MEQESNGTSTDRDFYAAIVYEKLHEAITRYREKLHQAKQRGSIEYVAWITRNILELRIWVEYCSASADRAKEFYLDSVRDLNNLNKDADDLTADTREKLGRVHTIKTIDW